MSAEPFQNRTTIKLTFQSLLLFGLVILLYIPGLSGPFMLDDYGTLPSLYETMKHRGFWYAILDGGTGPTGRPISLISFALQQQHWEDPFYFKLVNVIIHGVNALLVFWLCHMIVKRLPLQLNSNASLVCLAVALIWALHPVQVSSALYVVQRMVLLSSTFILLGCITYIYGRTKIEQNNLRAGYLLTTLSIVFFGLLALLSKEIGFQVILYILCIESTLFTLHKIKNVKLLIYWRHLFITLPITLIFAYLFFKLDGYLVTYDTLRNFSLGERLLTQTKILWEYCAQIIFPRISELGLYHDNHPTLKSLLDPIAILSVSATLGVLISAITLRQKYPTYSFAALWFLLGHSMEASFIPLELYFEHRNYIPSFGIILGSVLLLYWLAAHINSSILKLAYTALIFMIPALLTALTFQQTILWGNSTEYALVQAQEHQDSVRARSLMIAELSKANQLEKGYEETQRMKQQFKLPSIWLMESEYACAGAHYNLPEIGELSELVSGSRLDIASVYKWFDLLESALEGECDALTADFLLAVLNVFEQSPKYAAREQDFISSRATIYGALKNDLSSAIQTLLPDSKLSYENRMLLARYLASAGRLQEALIVLNNAQLSLGTSLKNNVKHEEIYELRSAIQKDINTAKQNIDHPV